MNEQRSKASIYCDLCRLLRPAAWRERAKLGRIKPRCFLQLGDSALLPQCWFRAPLANFLFSLDPSKDHKPKSAMAQSRLASITNHLAPGPSYLQKRDDDVVIGEETARPGAAHTKPLSIVLSFSYSRCKAYGYDQSFQRSSIARSDRRYSLSSYQRHFS